jgi:hypothetical protein
MSATLPISTIEGLFRQIWFRLSSSCRKRFGNRNDIDAAHADDRMGFICVIPTAKPFRGDVLRSMLALLVLET